jgi:DMSO/TMAO reductase YedYZ molybdopterin-dependent catalytic subunit
MKRTGQYRIVCGLCAISLFWAAPHHSFAQTATATASKETAATGTFSVTGAVIKPGVWTVERIRKELAAELRNVDYTLKGKKGQAQCIPLLSLLKAAEPRLNPRAKNHLLSFVAFVRAEDGYTASFSLGELQPEVGKSEVWIALDRNGNAIPGDDGPVELIVTTDQKPARWVHGVSRIVLVDGIAETDKPASEGNVKP